MLGGELGGVEADNPNTVRSSRTGTKRKGGGPHVPSGQQWSCHFRGQHPLLPHAATYSLLWISWQGYGAAGLAHPPSASVFWSVCLGADVPFPTAAPGREERASSLFLPSTSQRNLFLSFCWHCTWEEAEAAEGLCPSRSCQVEQDKRLSSALWDREVRARLWFSEAS